MTTLLVVAGNAFAAVVLRILRPNLLTAAVLAIVVSASTAFLGAEYGSELLHNLHRTRDLVLSASGHEPAWPAERLRTYPDLELIDQDGKTTRLSEFRGKVILLQMVGMSSPTCIAFTGGSQEHYGNYRAQPGLESIADCAKRYADVSLDDDRIVFVQIVLFDDQMQAPAPLDVQRWASHFELQRAAGQVVLAGSAQMANRTGRNLIPGFQLIDQNFLLRSDSTGRRPETDLYTELLPLMGQLVNQ